MSRSYADVCIPTASLEEYLDRMEEVIECAPIMPFTGKCILDRKEIRGLIDAIRGVVGHAGSDLSTTKSFKQSRTAPFTAVGADELDDIPDMPENLKPVEIAQKAVESPEIEDAKAEALRIIEAAKAEAVKIRAGADDYAENTLASVEQNALGAARSARKGLDVLQRRRASGS